ncbi:hypothetical protein AVEN_103804-1 [Araneus ventricosus]|uniref:Uncharacterized protein n=1 Tax=Araneus ventricosus TaxID=182803 RepID=A0A4Y2G739_ARAVE|nr:hypothetical protein AVEN_103804-1 [Araneus ventricosus]
MLSDPNALECRVMVSSSYMAILILLAKLKNCCESSSGKSGATHLQTRFGTQSCSKHLSGTRFSSESDVKTVVENWLNRQGRDFCHAGLNEWVLRSDKCLNRFGDDVEK